MRILFVGDEASLPSELSDYVADLGDEWQAQQVADGNSAIEAAALSPFDAVIVAPVLPDLTAATLLGQIRKLRPDTIRIALIDVQDGQRTPPARIIGVAHRFLPMPLAPEVLLEAVTSLEELRDLLTNPRLRAAIGRISSQSTSRRKRIVKDRREAVNQSMLPDAHPSQTGNFFATATFFRLTYFGRPSLP